MKKTSSPQVEQYPEPVSAFREKPGLGEIFITQGGVRNRIYRESPGRFATMDNGSIGGVAIGLLFTMGFHAAEPVRPY